ncbi:MAG: HAD family hydrolase [Deltaproteobacteria bacterium]|nr:HAD family hydrolase [Deltaproteobacteria bacterium]
MAIKGILFDLYGTLIDIETDESLEEIYRGIAHYLTYHGVYLHRWEVRDRYHQIMKQQKEEGGEEYPEIDVEAIWNTFLEREGIKAAPARRDLARILAQLYRGISRKRLQLYPEVKRVLDDLQPHYRMALISDAQPGYALPEIKAVGLDGYFDPIILSAYYGFRKPDARLFSKSLDILNLTPAEVIYVGNDMYRDIYGASRLGIKTLFVDSNQGAKSYENVTPDYIAPRFEDVLKGVEEIKRSLLLKQESE